MKSLIVEDERTSQEIIKAIVKCYGDVQCAADASVGFDLFLKSLRDGSPFNVIFLDINLPGLDGIELLDELRRVEQEFGIVGSDGVKVIMTTGESDPDTYFDAEHTGCTSYFTKPIDRTKLIAELNRLKLI